MNVPAMLYKTAWLPLTPRGVVAFATARFRRAFWVQFVFALLATAAVGWFLRTAIAPTFRAAIDALPDESQITTGVLMWPTNAAQPVLLAEGRVISVVVDLDQTGRVASSADLKLQFGRTDWQLASFFGVLHVPGLLDTTYPLAYTVALNRADLLPWWGAREPFLIGVVMVGMVFSLLASWWTLATFYAPLVWLGAFFGNRDVGLLGCWRIAGAAQMPGAIFMTAAIVFYGLGAFQLPQLLLAVVMHLVIGWFYLVVSVMALPRMATPEASSENPFKP
jgi:hypothetical protein